MWLKTLGIYFLIILDVMVLPFSCAGSSKKNKLIIEIQIQDQGHEYSYFDRTVDNIPKNNIISSIDTIDFEEENYRIIGWYIYNYETDSEDLSSSIELLSFPYTIQEEDYLSYYTGYRNCVVIRAYWEYVENDTI